MRDSVVLNTSGMSQILSEVEESVNEYSDNLRKLKEKNVDVKTYDEVKKGSLAKVYGGVVDEYYKLCEMLASCSLTLMDMRTLKKQLSEVKIVPSIAQQFRIRIERIIIDMSDLRNALQVMKEAYDAKLRFYNSCQYMMNGSVFVDRS